MKILVTGASGMLGATLVKVLTKYHSVYATGNSEYLESPVPYKVFNLADDSYQELIDWSQPELIIHSGALTNGNYCNENPIEAFNVNGVSVQKFLKYTHESVKLIYISTDAVFPSSLHKAKEVDFVFPENVYGKSKELGEFFLLTSSRDYSIIRTTIVGLNENNKKQGFVEWILNSVSNSKSIGLFTDVLFTPISIWDLAIEISFLIDNDCISKEIIHITGDEIMSKYDFGYALAQALNLPVENITKSSIASFKDRAKRCSDQTLDVSYYQKKYKRNLPTLEDTITSIKRYFNE